MKTSTPGNKSFAGSVNLSTFALSAVVVAVKILPLLLDDDATRPTCEATMLLRDTVEKAVVVRASDPRDRAAVSADLRMCMVALSTTVGYNSEEEGGRRRPSDHASTSL